MAPAAREETQLHARDALAFLATWGVIDAVIQAGRYLILGARTTPANAPRR